MKNTGFHPAGAKPEKRIVNVLIEAFIVSVVGFAVAMVANSVSPRGLSLTRNYFPPAPTQGVTATNHAGAVASPVLLATNASPENKLAGRLAARGLRLMEFAEVRQLYEDPRREQELIVFVDARNEESYLEGHIPAAYHFDHYYPDKYLPAVFPACQQAETVIVYCIGGDCEDSEFASAYLVDAGIPAARLNVFAGGFDAWKTNGMPVEIGPRGSGELQQMKQ